MRIWFKMQDVRKKLQTLKGTKVRLVHDDGTYLLFNPGEILKPIKGGAAGGVGDDFVENINKRDLTSIPDNAMDLVLIVTANKFEISYTVNS